MQEQDIYFPLLSLPHLPLITIVKCLDRDDQLALAGSCRQLAAVVSAASNNTWLIVTRSTGWEGLCKVLTTNTIICKALRLSGKVSPAEQSARNNALDVLLQNKAVSEYSLKGIKHVDINAYPLPCLLPPNLVSVFPNLESLTVLGGMNRFGHLQPLPYCSSLRKLMYRDIEVTQLPSRYHTADDLRRQLPNIDTLYLKTGRYRDRDRGVDLSRSFISDMLQAWGDQLTRLDCDIDISTSQLRLCTRLQSLTWNSPWTSPLAPLLTSLPSCLTTLCLKDRVLQDSDLEVILQLPSLCNLACLGVSRNLQRDWSSHPRTLQLLAFDKMPMVHLSKLPLRSLRGTGVLKIKRLILPPLRHPGSLAEVTYAAQCVSNAGITVEGFEDWECEPWENALPDSVIPSEVDAVCAELIRAASRIVQPFSCYKLFIPPLSAFPRTVTALITWLSPALKQLSINKQKEMLHPWLWQELQRCCKLEEVNVGYTVSDNHAPFSIKETTIMLIYLAAKHYVVATHRPLMLSFQGHYSLYPPIDMLSIQMQQKLPRGVSLLACSWDSNNCSHRLIVKLASAGQHPAEHLAVQRGTSKTDTYIRELQWVLKDL